MLTAQTLLFPEEKECIRYLGVLIDSKLSWTHHIIYISTKISKSLGILARLKAFCPFFHFIKHISFSFVQPYLSFWYSLKGPSCSYKFGENLILQKRAIRLLIPFKPFRFHVVPLFNFLYFKTIYLIMHDVSNNVTPPNVSNLFTYSSKVHHHLRLAISILRTRELNV